MDAVKLLKEEHTAILQLLQRLTAARSAQQRELLLTLLNEKMKAHETIEESAVYPHYQEVTADRQRYYEAKEEHHFIDIVLDELQEVAPSSDRFRAKAAVLRELVRHHIKEEEMMLRSLKSEGDIRALSQRLQRGINEYTTARTAAYAARKWR